MKYVVVTGGVVSGLGKGITISSIGRILKASGLRVTSIKIDPYLNVDAGTMSPFEHGEVFVLDDGGEADLDLGNYERFLDLTLTKDHNITTGKMYGHVLEKERKGDYLGKTVQVRRPRPACRATTLFSSWRRPPLRYRARIRPHACESTRVVRLGAAAAARAHAASGSRRRPPRDLAHVLTSVARCCSARRRPPRAGRSPRGPFFRVRARSGPLRPRRGGRGARARGGGGAGRCIPRRWCRT